MPSSVAAALTDQTCGDCSRATLRGVSAGRLPPTRAFPGGLRRTTHRCFSSSVARDVFINCPFKAA